MAHETEKLVEQLLSVTERMIQQAERDCWDQFEWALKERGRLLESLEKQSKEETPLLDSSAAQMQKLAQRSQRLKDIVKEKAKSTLYEREALFGEKRNVLEEEMVSGKGQRLEKKG